MLDPLFRLALEGLNLALLIGGIVVQLPQIYAIYKQGNAEGLSETAWLIVVVSTGSYVVYNYSLGFPFGTWGDAFFAVVEYMIIVGMIWWHRRNEVAMHSTRTLYAAAVGLVIILTLAGKLPMPVLKIMGTLPIPTVIISRVPQILLNYRRKDVGVLSLSSLAMQCGGNFGRIVSTIVLVPDPLVLVSHLAAFSVNATLLLQALIYGSGKGVAKKQDGPATGQTDEQPVEAIRRKKL